MIQINNIRKKYGSSVILHGMTLRLEKSKAYGIVGENGAGKSTLFRCLAGLEHYQGNIIMEEHCRIGYLPILLTFTRWLPARSFWNSA